jgi:hypothetical protein
MINKKDQGICILELLVNANKTSLYPANWLFLKSIINSK